MPDAKGLIHKDKLMEYFQRTLGSIVDNEALEKMEADENGMINIEVSNKLGICICILINSTV